MVGKLMKHEIKSLFRVVLAIGIAGVAFAILARIAWAMNTPSGEGAMDANPSIGALLLTLIAVYLLLATLIAAYAVSIQTFAKSLFSGQGYMTFSLPASVSEILIAKLLSAIVLMFASAVVMFGGYFIMMTALPEDALETIYQLMNIFGAYLSSEPLLVVESVLSVIVSLPTFLLFCYLGCSVGQLFTKHRKALTFALVLGVLFVASLLSTFTTSLTPKMIAVSPHLYMWVNIIWSAGLNVAMFFGIRYILTHKLNILT